MVLLQSDKQLYKSGNGVRALKPSDLRQTGINFGGGETTERHQLPKFILDIHPLNASGS